MPCRSATLLLSCRCDVDQPTDQHTAHHEQELDSEGRVVMTDHGAFVLINVYGPAISSEERLEDRFAFKLQLYQVWPWYHPTSQSAHAYGHPLMLATTTRHSVCGCMRFWMPAAA